MFDNRIDREHLSLSVVKYGSPEIFIIKYGNPDFSVSTGVWKKNTWKIGVRNNSLESGVRPNFGDKNSRSRKVLEI